MSAGVSAVNSASHVIKTLCPKQFSGWTEHIPGMVMHRWTPHGSETLLHGVTDVVTKTPVTAESRIPIGSITKTYTAALMLKLEELGLLKLSDKLTQYVPEKLLEGIANAKEVTLKQLLQHTSGIHEYSNSVFAQKLAELHHNAKALPLTLFDKLACLPKVPALFSPGQRYHYSNTNYLLLEPVIETVTKLPVQQAFQTHLLTPLGLKNTQLGVQHATVKQYDHLIHFPLLHKPGVVQDVTRLDRLDNSLTDGGIVASASEVAQFFRSLFHDKKYLSEASLKTMLGDTVKVSEHSEHGLGILINKHPENGNRGKALYEYTGSLIGSHAYTAYAPQAGEVISVVGNRSINNAPHPNLSTLARNILKT